MGEGRRWALLAGLGLALGAIALGSLGLGAVRLSPGEVVRALVTPQEVEASVRTIVWDLRLARVLLAMAVGAALGMAGTAYQGLFRNPLADPYVIGASGGAALGATLAIALGLGRGALGFGPVPLSAFVGALLAVAAVYAVAQVGGSAPPIALLLAGASLSTFLGAVVSLLLLLSEESFPRAFAWLLGSLSGRSWPHLWASLPYLVLGSALVMAMARALDALAWGEETARSLGLPLGRARGAIVAGATLATAGAVAAGGIIGFVGLVAPHMVRLLVGARHFRLLPSSALAGALLLLLADDLARTVMAPMELPVGILTAALGGPFFLYLLRRHQRRLGGGG